MRVFQRFSTVDALSDGRAEVILGRGSFTESFPLFGYDLSDYDVLFEEKIELFAKLLEEKPVTWSGTKRAALDNADVFPKTESGHLSTWVGVGGSPQSVVRTAHYGFPLMIAIIGGNPERFAPISTSTSAPPTSSVRPPIRSGCTRRASSPTRTRRPANCTGRTTGSSATVSARCGVAGDPQAGVRRRDRARLPLRRSPETVARKMADAVKALDVGRFDLIYTSERSPSAPVCAPSSCTAAR